MQQLIVCLRDCSIDAEKKRKMTFSPLYITYLFEEIEREEHVGVNIRYLFPMQPVNADKRWSCAVAVSTSQKIALTQMYSSCLASCALLFLCARLSTPRCV